MTTSHTPEPKEVEDYQEDGEILDDDDDVPTEIPNITSEC